MGNYHDGKKRKNFHGKNRRKDNCITNGKIHKRHQRVDFVMDSRMDSRMDLTKMTKDIVSDFLLPLLPRMSQLRLLRLNQTYRHYFGFPVVSSLLWKFDTRLQYNKPFITHLIIDHYSTKNLDAWEKKSICCPQLTYLSLTSWSGPLTFNENFPLLTELQLNGFSIGAFVNVERLPRSLKKLTISGNCFLNVQKESDWPRLLYFKEEWYYHQYQNGRHIYCLPNSLLILHTALLHEDVTLPENLKELHTTSYETTLDFSLLPKSLELLDIDMSKLKYMSGIHEKLQTLILPLPFAFGNLDIRCYFPDCIESLTLCECPNVFYESKNYWPKSLTYFKVYYGKFHIDRIHWPSTIKHLCLSADFVEEITSTKVLPSFLEKLELSKQYPLQLLKNIILPLTLTELFINHNTKIHLINYQDHKKVRVEVIKIVYPP